MDLFVRSRVRCESLEKFPYLLNQLLELMRNNPSIIHPGGTLVVYFKPRHFSLSLVTIKSKLEP